MAQALIAIAMAIALVGFIVLGDLTQKLITIPRQLMAAVWRARLWLMALSLIAITVGLVLGLDQGLLSAGQAAALAGGFAVLFFSGFVLVPHVMFKPDTTAARFKSHESVAGFLDSDAEIAVVEQDGEVRGYPLDWISRCHLAANADEPLGADGVVMTYCSLSHAAMAFAPTIGGSKLELGVTAQLASNLVLHDRRSGRLIQQLYGSLGLEPGGEAMARAAVRLMPYRSYRALYPMGRVYFNPPGATFLNPSARLWDRMVRGLLTVILARHFDPARPGPWFPTIPSIDDRLAPKSFVYAFDIDGDRVAYSHEFLVAQGGRIEPVIGGRRLAIVDYPELDFVDAYRLDGPVGDIGPDGKTADGQALERQPMIAKMLWLVWAHYFPDSDINRL